MSCELVARQVQGLGLFPDLGAPEGPGRWVPRRSEPVQAGLAPASLAPAPPAPALPACCFPRFSRLRAARAPQDLGRRLPPRALAAAEPGAQSCSPCCRPWLPGGPGHRGTPPQAPA